MNQEVLSLLEDADKIVIGIGESFERRDPELETKEFLLYEKEEPLLAGFKRLEYWMQNQEGDRVIEAYNRLYELVENKDYFVVTTCMDDRIYRSRFPEDKITAPCGTWRYLQCSECCREELLPVSKEMIEKKEMIYCPSCQKKVLFNRVTCEKYNEAGYLPQWTMYRNWLQKTINKKLCIIELGVGMKYPTIIRWPFEKIAYCNNKASFVRVHNFLYQMTEELGQKGIGIEANPIEFLLE